MWLKFWENGELVEGIENIEVPTEYVKIREDCRVSPKALNAINAFFLIKDWSKALASMFLKTPHDMHGCTRVAHCVTAP